MKPTLTSRLTALLLSPLVDGQAKPEVAKATKAATRAWESAPAEKKALRRQHREALKHIDLSDDAQRQIVIAPGSPKAGEDHAHSATAMPADDKTISCVWNIGHGGRAGPMDRCDDGGLTWTRIDDTLQPAEDLQRRLLPRPPPVARGNDRCHDVPAFPAGHQVTL